MKNIYKISQKPIAILISWIAFLLSPLLGLIRIKFIVGDAGFKIAIPGLSRLFFYGPYLISIFVLVMIILWFRAFTRKELSSMHIKYLGIISIMSLIFLVFAQYMMGLEFNHYPNYLYQYYGITFPQLQLMSFVAGMQLTLFGAFIIFKRTFTKSKKFLDSSESFFGDDLKSIGGRIYLIISIVGILTLLVSAGATLFNWRTFLRSSVGGYEGKVGLDYKYIKSLSENTPSEVSTKIIHPPQSDKYPAIGNQPVIRYFLHPRTLVSGELFQNQEFAKEINSAYFAVIEKDGPRHWPTIDTKKRNINLNGRDSINYSSLKVYYSNEETIIYEVEF